MLKRKDLVGFITNYQPSFRRYDATADPSSSELISKRIKTDSDSENRNYMSYKLNEIKSKYSSRRETPLNEISCERMRNLNNFKIKQVDSPISYLQKGREREREGNYYSSKGLGNGGGGGNGEEKRGWERREEEMRGYQTEPRIQSIDKINMKIKSILKTIEGSEREFMNQRTSIAKENPQSYDNSNLKHKP